MKQLKQLKIADYFTLAGLVSAVLSLYFSHLEMFLFAYLLLVLQFILDGVDGRIARKYGEGKLGFFLDSFSDFTSIIACSGFGFFYIHKTEDFYIDNLINISLIIFIISGAIRLSYFSNRSLEGKKDFIGIPTVLAVFIISTVLIISYLFFPESNIQYLSFLYLIFSYGMLSDFIIKKL